MNRKTRKEKKRGRRREARFDLSSSLLPAAACRVTCSTQLTAAELARPQPHGSKLYNEAAALEQQGDLIQSKDDLLAAAKEPARRLFHGRRPLDSWPNFR
jgi:hypothetical protein